MFCLEALWQIHFALEQSYAVSILALNIDVLSWTTLYTLESKLDLSFRLREALVSEEKASKVSLQHCVSQWIGW
jgi:hypothetical protein